jgi:hypothetical protein
MRVHVVKVLLSFFAIIIGFIFFLFLEFWVKIVYFAAWFVVIVYLIVKKVLKET